MQLFATHPHEAYIVHTLERKLSGLAVCGGGASGVTKLSGLAVCGGGALGVTKLSGLAVCGAGASGVTVISVMSRCRIRSDRGPTNNGHCVYLTICWSTLLR